MNCKQCPCNTNSNVCGQSVFYDGRVDKCSTLTKYLERKRERDDRAEGGKDGS